jgi:hypothetical protein
VHFFAGKKILKKIRFTNISTVLNARIHLEMVTWIVPDSVSLTLDRSEGQGLTTLHGAK